jgi:hypothetical protein
MMTSSSDTTPSQSKSADGSWVPILPAISDRSAAVTARSPF